MKEELTPELKKQKKTRNKTSYILIAFAAGLSSIAELAVQYFLKDELKLEPATMSQIYSIIYIPWMIKPLFGFITDLFPVFGYRRKIYIMLSSILIMLSWITLSLHTKTLLEATILLTLVNCGLSFSTVLGEAIVVELSQLEEDKTKVNEKAKNYVSLFFATKYTGALFSSYLKGLFVELMNVRKVFLIASIVPLLIFLSGVMLLENRLGKGENDFLDEDEKNSLLKNNNKAEDQKLVEAEKKTDNNVSMIEDKSIIVDEKKDFIENYALENSADKKETKIDRGQMVVDFFKFLSQKYVYVPTIFLVVFMATPSYSDPFFYFLTNELKFKATQLGKIAFCSTLATLLSIIFYRYYLKNSNFKTIIIISSLLAYLINFLAYILVSRINVTLGIPNFWLCLISNSLLAGLGELILMPMLSLACQLCPKNLEGTVYSFFMSALNFGGIMSGLNGSFLTNALGITSKDFKNLPLLIFISNVVSILPLFMLICIDKSYFHPSANESTSNDIENEKKNTKEKHECIIPKEKEEPPIKDLEKEKINNYSSQKILEDEKK